MADLDDIKEGKNFGLDRPQQNTLYMLKGCGSLEWGMQSRLARIFNPQSNRTVMLAFDHGYFQGPTTGLERIDLSIAPLFEETDVADVHPRRAAQSGAGGDQQTGGAARFRRQLDP
ncbi:Autoinducer 2 (AI-2) aldolase LsrF [Klebsiella michiganensis]|uniref:Autoinducer 2 (AI-2) aldolase LsrF n=1 Tax=Klebsiella michiganensis TaxID=1134687 RepID=A0A7H4M5P4_9ENTR|nr:Autoinducer 2 (AI-2) aldolase LsrF [Klebsiella michiganensis]